MSSTLQCIYQNSRLLVSLVFLFFVEGAHSYNLQTNDHYINSLAIQFTLSLQFYEHCSVICWILYVVIVNSLIHQKHIAEFNKWNRLWGWNNFFLNFLSLPFPPMHTPDCLIKWNNIILLGFSILPFPEIRQPLPLLALSQHNQDSWVHM